MKYNLQILYHYYNSVVKYVFKTNIYKFNISAKREQSANKSNVEIFDLILSMKWIIEVF